MKTRTEIHTEMCRRELDWMYNRHSVGPGADAADCPATLLDIESIAHDAERNGVDADVIRSWRAAASDVIGS